MTPVRSLIATLMLLLAMGTQAQEGAPSTVTPSGIRLNPNLFKAIEESADKLTLVGPNAPRPANPVPTFAEGKPVIALASAIGGELHVVLGKETVGSTIAALDPNTRISLPISDVSIDAMVLRGLDRVVARTVPDSERVFMRLNPVMLEDVPPNQREQVALKRLVAEISRWPQRQQWDRIIVVVPHYRGFERNGLGSKLHGIGLYVQNLDINQTEYEVIEPDGTPGAQRRNRYVALYYYAMMVVLDAKSLAVLDSQAWLIDEKIYDSKSEALNVLKAVPTDVLARRIESFAENASRTALTRTLTGTIEAGEPRAIQPGGAAAPPPAGRPSVPGGTPPAAPTR